MVRKIDPNESIYLAYWNLIQKLKKKAYLEDNLTIALFESSDREESLLLKKFEKIHRAIKLLRISAKPNFDSLLKGKSIYPEIFSITILPEALSKLEKEVLAHLSNFKKDTSFVEPKDSFGFEDSTFWLKRVAARELIIKFNPPPNKKASDTLLLFEAMIYYLKIMGEPDGPMLKAVIPVDEIISYLNKKFSMSKNRHWINDTKSNLVKKLTEEDKKFINVGDFDKKNNGYPLSLKLPMMDKDSS